MKFKLIPNIGSNFFEFNTHRDVIRNKYNLHYEIKEDEPENDFYTNDGFILGYNENNRLEYIEIYKPSTAEYNEIELLSLSKKNFLDKMKKISNNYFFDDGGYFFPSLCITAYCPFNEIESIAIYVDGYYSDIE